MSTVLISLISIGVFAILIWYRDRVVRWRAFGLSILAMPVYGVLITFGTLVANAVGGIDLSFEMTAIELTGRLAQLVLICGAALLLVSILPVGVLPIVDQLISDRTHSDDGDSPGDSTEP